MLTFEGVISATPKIAWLLPLALCAAVGAAAQDEAPRRAERPSIANEARPRPPECGEARYTLCAGESRLVPRSLLAPDPPRRGRWTRVTRLAGMFMGRVEAAHVGPFQLRIRLDIR